MPMLVQMTSSWAFMNYVPFPNIKPKSASLAVHCIAVFLSLQVAGQRLLCVHALLCCVWPCLSPIILNAVMHAEGHRNHSLFCVQPCLERSQNVYTFIISRLLCVI